MTPAARKPSPERHARAQAEYAAFRELIDENATLRHDSTKRWRNGLVTILAIALTSLVLKGPDTAQTITTGWRVALTAVVGLGASLAAGRPGFALRTSAGAPRRTIFTEILDDYGTDHLSEET